MRLEDILQYVSLFLALLIVLPLHEFAHAFVADRFGDKTPKLNGRLTINPLAHFDVTGLVALFLVRFGWGKPVPINPNNFKKRKLGCFCVSIAGVCMNYIVAFLFYPLFLLFLNGVASGIIPDIGYFDEVLLETLYYIPILSLYLFAFNILPLYPLDGFNLIDSLNRRRGPIYRFLRNYGQLILLGLIFLGLIANITHFYYLDVLGIALNYISDWLFVPIKSFWGLFF